MSDIATMAAVRSTWLHYAQLTAQIQREDAKRNGDLFADAQCRKCGLFHASTPCHPYMKNLNYRAP